jgi:glycosyltransferase 2 family protein
VGLGRVAALGWLGGAAVAAGGAVLLGAVALAIGLALAPRAGLPAPPGWLPARLVRVWLRLGVALAGIWVRFASGAVAALRLPRAYQLVVVALTLVVWGNACLATVLSLAAFGLPADWALAAVLYGALLLGLSVPSAPGGLGPFELVTVAVLEGVGLAPDPSAAFALGFHGVTFVPLLVTGAVAYLLALALGAPPGLRGD